MDTITSNSFGKYQNYVIIAHGFTNRLLYMRYKKMKIDDFLKLKNPKNCETWILEKNEKGNYELNSNNKLVPILE